MDGGSYMFEGSLIDKVKLAALSMQRYSWEQGTVAQAFWNRAMQIQLL